MTEIEQLQRFIQYATIMPPHVAEGPAVLLEWQGNEDGLQVARRIPRRGGRTPFKLY